jgi:hypothetical protein
MRKNSPQSSSDPKGLLLLKALQGFKGMIDGIKRYSYQKPKTEN